MNTRKSQTAALQVGRNRSLVLFVASAAAFVGISFAAGAPSPLYVVFQQQWHFPAWVLTIAFAIYAVTLLITLLVAGSLSDYVGRRPVLITALVLEALAMILFAVAPNIAWIIVARALQGIATGAATSTFSAAIVELAPESHKKVGTLLVGVIPFAGLGLGALLTGLAIQTTLYPTLIIFGFLTLVFIGGTIVVVATPETVSRRPGAIQSLVPRVSVPRIVRSEFWAAVPLLIATWMVAGLFFGLVPSILRGVFHVTNGLVSGALIALQPVAATVTSVLFGKLPARQAVIFGGAALVFGFAILVSGIALSVFPLLFLGALVGGAGFGTAFSGSLRVMAPLVEAHQRAELFTVLYLVGYLAFGVPVVIAGDFITALGLHSTVLAYGAAAILLATIGLFWQMGLARRESFAAELPGTKPSSMAECDFCN